MAKKKSTESKAMKIVMNYEQKEGRKPKDVSKTRCGYDIKSKGRYIEVKGKNRGDEVPQWIDLYKKLISQLGKKIMHYYIYIAYDIDKKPKLLIFSAADILPNLVIENKFTFYPKKAMKINPKIKSIVMR